MGTRGHRPFENELALDWTATLPVGGLRAIEAPFDEVNGSDVFPGLGIGRRA